MDDRTLLELAAKAAGLKIDKSWDGSVSDRGSGFDIAGNVVLDWHNGTTWNPLTDDGDALRLAVAIAAKFPGARFEVGISKMHDGRGFCAAGFWSRDKPHESAVDADLGAATRRAIVRAAAIGSGDTGQG